LGLKDDELAIASALILGFKDYLNEPLKKSYASAGAMHVLAVSGLHVGIIYILLKSLFFFLRKSKKGKYLEALLSFLALWGYAILTGLSPSVIRAATMFSFFVFGDVLDRKSNIYNVLAASAVLILIFNPFMIVEVGFQLSYLAVLGIVYVQPKLYKLVNTEITSIKPINWLIDKIWALTTVSIGAQLGTFPLALLYFHLFPTYFLFSNLVVIPAAIMIVYVGVAVLITSFIPFISKILASILSFIIYILNSAVSLIDQLPHSMISGVSISILETWLIYGLICAVLFFIAKKQVYSLFIGLIVGIIIISIDFKEDRAILNTNQLTLYNINKHTAFEIRKGKSCMVFMDTALLNNVDKQSFHLQQNWWKNDVNHLEKMELSALEGLVTFEGKRILLLHQANKKWFFEKRPQLKVDYLVISENIYVNLTELFRFVDPERIVLDSSLDFKKRSGMIKYLKKRGIEVLDIRENGVFILET
jgi:competence protein ComEC